MYEHWEPVVPAVVAPHSLAARVKAPVEILPYWLHWEGPRFSRRVVEGVVGRASAREMAMLVSSKDGDFKRCILLYHSND